MISNRKRARRLKERRRKALDVDVCKRMSSRPCNITLQRRCMRAMKGKPTYMKRKDILMYIRRLYNRITAYGSKSKITLNAIIHREGQLYDDFDPRFGEVRAKTLMRTAGMNANTKYAESLQKVIKKLRAGDDVKGFTLMRTCKVKGHPLLIKVLDLDNEQTLCVRAIPDKGIKSKRHMEKLNKDKWGGCDGK